MRWKTYFENHSPLKLSVFFFLLIYLKIALFILSSSTLIWLPTLTLPPLLSTELMELVPSVTPSATGTFAIYMSCIFWTSFLLMAALASSSFCFFLSFSSWLITILMYFWLFYNSADFKLCFSFIYLSRASNIFKFCCLALSLLSFSSFSANLSFSSYCIKILLSWALSAASDFFITSPMRLMIFAIFSSLAAF